MTPKNIISIFAVRKKNDIGDMVLNAHSCRIVLDCSRTVNQMSHFKATQADGVTQIINKAAILLKRDLLVLWISRVCFIVLNLTANYGHSFV